MLKRVQRAPIGAVENGCFVLIASRYNARYVNGMLRAARAVLRAAPDVEVHVVRVPGAFEIPVVAAKLASGMGERLSAAICLGVILRGQTLHAQFIGESVTAALAQIQVAHQVPIIHEVLLLESKAQAQARCLSREHNRGAEAAYTALAMAKTMRDLKRIIR